MTGLVRAEWGKLFTTRVWIGLVAGSCALVGGVAALLTAFAGAAPDRGRGSAPVGTPAFEQGVLGVGTAATALLLILGIIGMTNEFRHRTATPTFLTTPRRGRVVVAKLLAYALASVPIAVVVLGVLVAVVEIYAGARGAAPSLTGDNLRILGWEAVALVLYTVIGVGVGALVRNQVGAIVGALVYLYVLEPLISAIPTVSSARPYLPGGALAAMTSTASSGGGTDLLAPWQGALLLLGYGLVTAVLGAVLTVRRDVV
jgi:hypothetical protein